MTDFADKTEHVGFVVGTFAVVVPQSVWRHTGINVAETIFYTFCRNTLDGNLTQFQRSTLSPETAYGIFHTQGGTNADSIAWTNVQMQVNQRSAAKTLVNIGRVVRRKPIVRHIATSHAVKLYFRICSLGLYQQT